MPYPYITATTDGDAGAAFVSAVQSSGLNVSTLNQISQLQLAVANLMLGEPATGGQFTNTMFSTTAIATPAALTATQFTAFASTVSGATLMGYGTTGDVTLKNRAGTTVAYVGPNTTAFTVVGNFTVGASTFVVTAATGAVDTTGRFSVERDGSDTLSAANAGLRLYDLSLGVGLYGQQKVSSPYGYHLQVSDPTFAAFFPLNLNPLGGVVNIASAGVQTTVLGPLAITGALTGVSTVNLTTQPAFVAGSKYLVISAAGDVQVSALGPAS